MITHYQHKYKSDVIALFKEYPLMFNEYDLAEAKDGDIKEYAHNYLRFVFVEDDVVKGFVSARSARKEEGSRNYWKIDFIVVGKKFAKQGIGRQLIEFIQDEIRKKGVKYIFLDTSDSNNKTSEAAVNFYKKNGFKSGGELPEFWGNKDSEMFFYKEL